MVVDSTAEKMAADVLAKLKGLGALAGVAMMTTGASMFMASETTDRVDPQIVGDADDMDLAGVDTMAAANPLKRQKSTEETKVMKNFLISRPNETSIHCGNASWGAFGNWSGTPLYTLIRSNNFDEVLDVANDTSAAEWNEALRVAGYTDRKDLSTGFIYNTDHGAKMTLAIDFVDNMAGSGCNGVRGIAIKDDHHNTVAEIVETENKRTLRLSLETKKRGFSGELHTEPLRSEPVAGPGTESGRLKYLLKIMEKRFVPDAMYDYVNYNFGALMQDRNHLVHHVENPEKLTWSFTCPRPGADTVVDAALPESLEVHKGVIRKKPAPRMQTLDFRT